VTLLEPRCLTGIASAHFFSRRFYDAVKLLLVSLEELPTYTPTYRFLAASYAHLGRLGEARAIIDRLRRVTSDVGTDARWWLRNAEQREFVASGLRLATGEGRPIEAAPPAAVAPVAADEAPRRFNPLRDTAPPREAERRQLTGMFCELVGVSVRSDGSGLEEWDQTIDGFQRCVSEMAGRRQGFVHRDLGNSALVQLAAPHRSAASR
jgi:hypothetical protein